MSRSNPRVSVGLAVYTGEHFLAEALDSLVGQAFEDFELIIPDNASTDGTEENCRAYALRPGGSAIPRIAKTWVPPGITTTCSIWPQASISNGLRTTTSCIRTSF